MTQQDEMSGLRDIIRHDEIMDRLALKRLDELKTLLQDGGVFNDDVDAKIDELETCIKSTLADENKKAPGVINQIEIVLADRPE